MMTDSRSWKSGHALGPMKQVYHALIPVDRDEPHLDERT